MIIVLEGPDGCGKTTIANAMAQALKAEVIHFPDYESVTGSMIKAYLKNEWYVERNGHAGGGFSNQDKAGAMVHQTLQLANRAERADDILCGKQHTILVRYWQSSWVYGQLDGLDGEHLATINAHLPQGDINILLDLDAVTSLKRQIKRGSAPERYEGEFEMTEKIVSLYRQLWGADGNLFMGTRWKKIDASRPPLEVTIDALGEVLHAR